MIYHLVAIPQLDDLKTLNSLRNYIYQNNFRFKNKPLDSDTHITLTQVDTEDTQLLKLKLEESIYTMKIFSIQKDEWKLTKEDKEPNYKISLPYSWIALRFPQREELFNSLDILTKELGINMNEEYLTNLKSIEKELKNKEGIADHINLSNYTRREKADECWDYFNTNLPDKITFNCLALRNQKGKLLFKLYLF